jgi:hypothetical protein
VISSDSTLGADEFLPIGAAASVLASNNALDLKLLNFAIKQLLRESQCFQQSEPEDTALHGQEKNIKNTSIHPRQQQLSSWVMETTGSISFMYVHIL